MRFLWFGRKKKVAPLVDLPEVREPQEVFSVADYICVNSPMKGGKGVELSSQLIDSLILSLLSKENSPADVAAQEFFQQKGANLQEVRDYSSHPERGSSARVVDAGTTRTVLIGRATTIARAATPFCEEIVAAVAATPDCKVVAIDGIAYATYSINRELI